MDARSAKKKAVLARIDSFEDAIRRAREYLENGKHADWSGFRPIFFAKWRDGKEPPPRKDWVEHVFLRRAERALRKHEKALDRLCREDASRARRRGFTLAD